MTKVNTFKLKAWQAGLVIGLVASIAQAGYYLLPQSVAGVAGYGPYPPAYGFCMYRHVRDVVTWVVQNFVSNVTPAPVSIIAQSDDLRGPAWRIRSSQEEQAVRLAPYDPPSQGFHLGGGHLLLRRPHGRMDP